MISVVVPVFNAATTLPQTLPALRREVSAFGDCELIYVDNGSTDGSRAIISECPEAVLLDEPKRGAYAARNRGAEAARGNILAFTDPDCIVRPGWLQAASDAMRYHACLVALGVRRPAPDIGLNRLLGDYEVTKDRWVLSSQDALKYYGFTNNMAMRREAWRRYGPFEERPRGADTIFVRRLVDGNGCDSVRFVPAMVVSHLEVDGLFAYLEKTFTYGRSLQSYAQVVRVKPLSFRDRLKIMRQTAQEHRFGIGRSAVLAGLLAAGLVAWSAGRVAAFGCDARV